ncbi:hypothetical protein YC2023_108888 [Brassica napus]
MHDEKKRSPIEFSQKVEDLEGSLVYKLQLLQDMMLREDHHAEPDQSITNLLRTGPTSTEQDLSRGDVYNSTATGSLNHQSKYSIFMFNHENTTLSQLPHSSLEQSLIPSYYNNINDSRTLLGAHGFNDNNNLSTTQGFFNFGYDNNALPEEQGLVDMTSISTIRKASTIFVHDGVKLYQPDFTFKLLLITQHYSIGSVQINQPDKTHNLVLVIL